ncbi:MAG TPA: FixH family protein [Polyangiaceae bacterium]|jgi:hypothetical protein
MKFLMPALATLGLLSACSGGAAPSEANAEYSAAPLLDLKSDTGLDVEVRTLPLQPPALGTSSVELTITDTATELPESGLDIKTVPWMPAMGHGTSVTPTVAETAPGVYEISGVVLFMPGTWELRTTLSGSVTDQVVPTFQIH